MNKYYIKNKINTANVYCQLFIDFLLLIFGFNQIYMYNKLFIYTAKKFKLFSMNLALVSLITFHIYWI